MYIIYSVVKILVTIFKILGFLDIPYYDSNNNMILLWFFSSKQLSSEKHCTQIVLDHLFYSMYFIGQFMKKIQKCR
jgi:hypothetical protein